MSQEIQWMWNHGFPQYPNWSQKLIRWVSIISQCASSCFSWNVSFRVCFTSQKNCCPPQQVGRRDNENHTDGSSNSLVWSNSSQHPSCDKSGVHFPHQCRAHHPTNLRHRPTLTSLHDTPFWFFARSCYNVLVHTSLGLVMTGLEVLSIVERRQDSSSPHAWWSTRWFKSFASETNLFWQIP